MRDFQEDTTESLNSLLFTLTISIVPHNDGGEEGKGVIGKMSALYFIVGNDAGLSFSIRGDVPYQFLNTLQGP